MSHLLASPGAKCIDSLEVPYLNAVPVTISMLAAAQMRLRDELLTNARVGIQSAARAVSATRVGGSH